jgi:hypothetical protein
MNEMMSEINKMMMDEAERIIEKYGQFADNNHFYGVIIEELEEADEDFTSILPILNKIWSEIRKKEDISVTDLRTIELFCEKTIEELIQVAAVCIKLRRKFGY